MRYTEATPGRTFLIRLQDGEILQESVEKFAREMKIRHAKVQLLGGADAGSKLIVGPVAGRERPIIPMIHELSEMHEVVGNGTICIDESGVPKLHCHIACGRGENTICGEVREGVIVWHVMEVVITELTQVKAIRKTDTETGFELLFPEKDFAPGD